MFNHIIPVLRHCVDAASDCRCVQVRVVIAMIAVTSYELMSVDDLQMLGVHVGRDPNQVVMFMTRDDCGKETKRESVAALESIAQQCETN